MGREVGGKGGSAAGWEAHRVTQLRHQKVAQRVGRGKGVRGKQEHGVLMDGHGNAGDVPCVQFQRKKDTGKEDKRTGQGERGERERRKKKKNKRKRKKESKREKEKGGEREKKEKREREINDSRCASTGRGGNSRAVSST